MIPRMPRWQSYVATTTNPMFTPEQCKMIIDAGHQCKPEEAKVGGSSSNATSSLSMAKMAGMEGA